MKSAIRTVDGIEKIEDSDLNMVDVEKIDKPGTKKPR